MEVGGAGAGQDEGGTDSWGLEGASEAWVSSVLC